MLDRQAQFHKLNEAVVPRSYPTWWVIKPAVVSGGVVLMLPSVRGMAPGCVNGLFAFVQDRQQERSSTQAALHDW